MEEHVDFGTSKRGRSSSLFKTQTANKNNKSFLDSLVLTDASLVWVTVQAKDHLRASINVQDEKIYQDIIFILTKRDYEKLEKFKRRHHILNPGVVEVIQGLSFLVEWCRTHKLASLIIDDASGQGRTCVELDLQRLNSCPKACCRTKNKSGTIVCCPRIGMISCAKCQVTTWCSEDCLDNSFEQHQDVCQAAVALLERLKL